MWDRSRNYKMAEMFRNGMTLQAIGDEYGLTRERVRQLIKKVGVTRDDGGDALGRAKRYGFDSIDQMNQYYEIYPNCVKRFTRQKQNAAIRKIQWKFNLKEWCDFWGDRYPDRGRGLESLVMCRYKDAGPYAKENCFIETCGFNNMAYAIRRFHGIDLDAFPI